MGTRKKIAIGVAMGMVILIILSSYEEGFVYRHINDIDLMTGRIRSSTYFCGIRTNQVERDTRYSKTIAEYCGEPSQPPQWHPDSQVFSGKVIGFIRGGGRAQASCGEFAMALEMAPLSDELKVQYARKAQGYLQTGEFGKIRELASELAEKL
jgi:hypothetical protein